MAEEFNAKLGIEVDFTQIDKLKEQINSIKKLPPIKIKLDVSDGVERQLKNIQDKIGKTNINISGKNEIDNITNAYKQLIATIKQINSLEVNTLRLDPISQKGNISSIYSQMERLSVEYDKIMSSYSSKFTAKQSAEINSLITRMAESQTAAQNKRLAAINKKANDGTYENQISALETKYLKLGVTSDTVNSKLKEMRSLLTAMKGDSFDNAVRSAESFKAAVSDVNNTLKSLSASNMQNGLAEKLVTNKSNLQYKIDSWLVTNSGASSQFKNQMEQIKAQIQSADSAKLTNLQAQFKQVSAEARTAGQNTQSFGDKLKNQFSKLSVYFSAVTVFQKTSEALRSMYDNVVKIDSAMTELKKVTNETDESYSNFLSGDAKTKSAEISANISDYISSTADFAKLGYSDLGQAQNLAKVANVYYNVGDGIESIDQASSNIIATMKAFNIEADDAMSIADKFNEVSNNFAISSGGIGDAMAKSASSLMASGNTIDEAIALITAANTTTQNPEIVGTAIKTLTMRIRGAKSELEAAGGDTDGMASSVSKLREELKALSGVDIMIDDNNFKSTYRILRELSKVWNNLSDVTRANITELIAGKRQGDVMSSLMNNFDIAEKAMATSSDSAGSAMKELSTWQTSLEAKTQELDNAWQSLSMTFLDTDFLKGGISGITGLVKVIDTLISSLGTIPTLAGAVAAALSFKNVGFFKLVDKENTLSGKGLNFSLSGLFSKNIKEFNLGDEFRNQLSKDKEYIQNYINAIKGGDTKENAFNATMLSSSGGAKNFVNNFNVDEIKNSTNVIEEFTKKTTQAQVAMKATDKSFGNVKSIIGEYKKLSAAGKDTSEFVKGVAQGNKQLGATLAQTGAATASASKLTAQYTGSLIAAKAASIGMQAASMALNAVLSMGVSFAISAVISGITKLANAQNIAAQKAAEAAEKSSQDAKAQKEKAQSIDELIAKYKQLKSSRSDDTYTRSEIKDIQSEITNLVGEQAGNLDLVNGKLDEELEKLKETAKEEKLKAQKKAENAYASAVSSAKKPTGKNEDNEDVASGRDYVFYDPNFFTVSKADREIFNILKRKSYAELTHHDMGTRAEIRSDIDNEGNDLDTAKERLEYLKEISEYIEQGNIEGYKGSEVWGNLQNRIEHYQEYVDKEVNALKETKDLVLSNLTDYNDELNKINVDSPEAYKKFRDTLLQKYKNNDTIIEALKNGDVTVEELEKDVDGYLGTLNKFSRYYTNFSKTISQAGDGKNTFAEIVRKYTEENNRAIEESEETKRDSKDENSFLLTDIGGNSSDIEKQSKEKAEDALNARKQGIIKAFKESRMKDSNIPEALGKEFDNWIQGLNSNGMDIIDNIVAKFPDAGTWAISKWKDEFYKLRDGTAEADTAMQSFYTTIGDNAEGGLSANITASAEQIKNLNDLYSKVDTGSLTQEEKLSIALQYPKLAPYINDTNALKKSIREMIDTANEGINGQIEQQIKEAGLEGTAAADAFRSLSGQIDELSKKKVVIDYDAELEKFNNLYNAMKNSKSATGMTTDDIQKVNAMFSELKGYDPSKLFEYTAHGIHMNTKELRNLQASYDDMKKSAAHKELNDLQDQYQNLTDKINNAQTASERAALVSERTGLSKQIEEAAIAADRYDALTNSYNRWIYAQQNGSETEQYDTIYSGISTVEDLISRGHGGNDEYIRTFFNMLTHDDLRNIPGSEVMEYQESVMNNAKRYFTAEDGKTNLDGVVNFLEDVNAKLGDAYAAYDEVTDTWSIDFGKGKDEEVAKALDLKVETLQALLRAASVSDMDINLDSEYSGLLGLVDDEVAALDKLKELKRDNKIDIDIPDFDFKTDNLDKATAQVEKAQKIYDSFKNEKGEIDIKTEGAKEAQDVLSALIKQEQFLKEPVVMKLNADNAVTDQEDAIAKLKEYWQAYENIEFKIKLGGTDSTALTEEMKQAVSQIQALDPTIKCDLGLNTNEVETALNNISNLKVGAEINQDDFAIINAAINTLTAEKLINFVPTLANDLEEKDTEKDGTVEYEADLTKANAEPVPPKTGTVVYNAQMNWSSYANLPTQVSGTISYVANVSSAVATAAAAASQLAGAVGVDGTAWADGTAFKEGNWGTKSGGKALVGELGTETLVRNGHYYTIGDSGAEFITYRPNDIIFNAEQTEQLFKYGKIISGRRRGKAFAEGTAFSNGSGGLRRRSSISSSSNYSDNSSNYSGNNDVSENIEEATDEAKEFKETLDWIEIVIKKIERAINSLDLSAASVYRGWRERNRSLTAQIKKTSEEIDLQKKAYDRYMKQANSIGLSEEYAKKVRDGVVDIEEITDEDLNNKINDYKEYYEKAMDAMDATETLRESISKLYSTSFENISTQFDSVFSRIDYWKNMTEETLSQAEERGRIANQRYYKTLAGKEQYRIKELEAERVKLVNALNKAVSSGAISKGSEEWNKLSNKINEVTLEIKKSNTELLKYKNNIRDIDWKISENVIDQMSQITREADFIINLLSSDKLYEDSGQLTDKGLSTMGMHFANYNVYMEQAKSYGEQLLEINRQIADDPKNQTLIDKKNELVKAQQEVILSAKGEKDAIKDMVKSGIEKELDALKKLIDKYEEAIESQKDLYDYQNKIKDQTSEISSLQKQLKAYEGDDSEETKAAIQKLRTSLNEAQKSLEESQYDKYVSDQKKLLDNFYDDYEETLNKRLDDIDKLMLDMRDTINSGTQNICDTVTESVTNAAYTLSENMSRLLTSHSVSGLVSYNTNESEGNTSENLTGIQNILSTIKEDTYNMVKLANISVRDAAAIARAIANGTDTSTLPKYYDYNGDGEINVRDSAAIANYLAGLTEELRTNGYASGVHEVSKSQYAWTQEKGREFIVRKSDGAVLTPLAKGDSVLTAEASGNIWSMANDPERFIRDNLRLNNINEKPVVNSNIGGVSVGDVSLNLSLPNVTNYKEFVYQMQHDSSFERMIQAMTVDKMFGKSSLRKYKM